MRPWEKELDQIATDEGLRLKAYSDTVGKLTIGYGRNLDDRGISKEEAMGMLRSDAYLAELDAMSLVAVWDTLPEEWKAVLVNMSYNLGVVRLGGFKRMLSAVDRRDAEGVRKEMLDSLWARQVGDRAVRLSNRIT